MLEAAAAHRMEDRILAVGNDVDFHDMPLTPLGVILRELTERPLELANAWQEAAFDDDFRVRRHAQLAGEALDDRKRTSMQRASDLQFVEINRRDRLRGEQRERIDADHDRGSQRLAL